jgi:ammonia channel protein AmtB
MAGGVAIGSSVDIVTKPWEAIAIGWAGGVICSISLHKIGPYLAKRINLVDTCGENSLHGLPAIFGALVSCIVIALSGDKGFPKDYFPAMEGGDKVAD